MPKNLTFSISIGLNVVVLLILIPMIYTIWHINERFGEIANQRSEKIILTNESGRTMGEAEVVNESISSFTLFDENGENCIYITNGPFFRFRDPGGGALELSTDPHTHKFLLSVYANGYARQNIEVVELIKSVFENQIEYIEN